MFTITSTRIVGLIAVVCAAVVAPQALASSTHNTAGDPSDVVQRYALRGEVSDQGFAPTALAAVPSQSPMGQPANNTPGGFDLIDLKNGRAAFTVATHKNAKAATFVYTPTNPGWGAAATAAKKSAAALSVNTSPLGWFCFDQAKYDYVNERCD